MNSDLSADIAAVQRIAAVPSILDIVCRFTGMGFAAVARVTEDRWVACQVLDNLHFGLAVGGELKVETTLCHEVRQCREVIVFDHADEDAVFRNHHTPRIYGLQSYISVPIQMPNGKFFGTLCAIDPSPHRVNTPEIIGTFKLFAELIAHHLDADEKLMQSSADLESERKTAEFREQFVAVLGHDLRNPLFALEAGASKLLREGWTDMSPSVLKLMKASIKRSQKLVENVMDFAQAKLGNGITLEIQSDGNLNATLVQIVEELRESHPDRTIETSFACDRQVAVDHSRLGQLASNLIGNAITHGAEDMPIFVEALATDEVFELSVVNGGAPIPPDVLARLFEPFNRGTANRLEGLGLGLYIVSRIAEAHGGRIDVRSRQGETAFTFTMPLPAPRP